MIQRRHPVKVRTQARTPCRPSVDPKLYLSQVIERIADHPIHRIHELLPWYLAARPNPAAKFQVSG